MVTQSANGRGAHPIRYPLPFCPACGSERLDPVVEHSARSVHFLCCDCNRCWNVALGYVQRVAPMTCAGCPERSRCEPTYEAECVSTHPLERQLVITL